jgi:hypothetical protein
LQAHQSTTVLHVLLKTVVEKTQCILNSIPMYLHFQIQTSLTFKITWLDKNPNSTWALKYYNASGLQTALNITGIGDNQWKTTNVTIRNPIINQNGVLGSDFMLVNTDAIDDIFHGIEVDITRTGTLSSIDYNSENSETLIFP